MTKHDVIWLFALLRLNKSVQKIIIKHTDLDIVECKAICKGVDNHSIRHFELRGCDIDDTELVTLGSSLSQLPRLEVLRLRDNVFTDKGGVILGNIKTITDLDISGCVGITDLTVQVVAKECKNIQALDLSRCLGVSDVGAGAIARITGLRDLNLSECVNLTDKAIESIAKSCPVLSRVDITSCKNIGGAAIVALANGCPN
eukprot:jgi/Bigna1/140156/aug1.54_g14864